MNSKQLLITAIFALSFTGCSLATPDRVLVPRTSNSSAEENKNNSKQDNTDGTINGSGGSKVALPNLPGGFPSNGNTSPSKTPNDALLEFYSNSDNYQHVYAEVRSWFYPRFGTMKNTCVAFMSTALSKAGVAIPEILDERKESTVLLTRPFSRYLEFTLGWKRITSVDEILPGDVMFSEDEKGYPGYPAHTYMFYAWDNKEIGTGIIVDNQGFMKKRNIFGYAEFNYTPFAYALRAQ